MRIVRRPLSSQHDYTTQIGHSTPDPSPLTFTTGKPPEPINSHSQNRTKETGVVPIFEVMKGLKRWGGRDMCVWDCVLSRLVSSVSVTGTFRSVRTN